MAINGNNSRRQSCPDGPTCPWCFPAKRAPIAERRRTFVGVDYAQGDDYATEIEVRHDGGGRYTVLGERKIAAPAPPAVPEKE